MAARNPTKSKHLEDQAAAAALYVTEPQKKTRDYRKEASYPLDANGKLTSAGAAASLRQANAQDLPSFPSVGIAQAAAGGAAGLAVQNTKSPEWWKPEASAGASKAALAANDYKMKPLWQPEASAAGSKAALLAHQKGHGLNLWEPSASDKALIAATGAAAGQKGTQHGKSAVNETGLGDRYPDEKNAAKNALSAATRVHTSTSTSKYNDLPGLSDEEAEKVRRQAMVKGMVGEMFGSNPLIGPELQERQHQESLHAAAITMAQGMYGKRDQAYRDKIAARAGSSAAARSLDGDSDDDDTPMSFMGLQEAAQKLANERLAKLNDPDAAYREHYGTNTSPPKNRFSMFSSGSLRRKDSDEDMADEKRSRKIRGEMNLFQDKLKEIDARKRKDDRSALLAAAQRNVKALSAEMDEDVFQRTGKMSPNMKADWEAQARARAQADSEERTANFGKVKIGGGKYMDQTEVDEIARSRLQPTLDAITAKAEHDREVDEENRLAEEERKRIERETKERENLQNIKIKEEWKKFSAEEKAEHNARKAEEKAIHDQEKEAEKDAKMQEKYVHNKQKEQEHDVKALEKEKEKQQKAEWKAFKEQEKEEEKARKEANRQSRGSRLGSIFRRKSKKDKETDQKEKDEPTSTPIPVGSGETTTTITAGEPAPLPTTDREEVAPVHEKAKDTTPAVEPVSEPATVHDKAIAPMDESKVTPGPIAAPIVVPIAVPVQEVHATAPVDKAVPTSTEPVAAATETVPAATETVHNTKDAVPGPVDPVAVQNEAVSPLDEFEDAPEALVAPVTLPPETPLSQSKDLTTEPQIVSSVTKLAPVEPESADSTTPAQPLSAQPVGSTPAATSAPVQTPVETSTREGTTTTKPEAPATAPLGPQAAGPVAIGSEKPVTSEINHSKIVDTLDPRANVGKPGFTGSEKFAAATADMRGTDHAGATQTSTEKTVATASDSGPSTGTSAQNTVAKSAEATHEGDKVDTPVAERIAVPAEAVAAAESATDKGGKHGTPRQAEQKKQNRLSGFFKSKLGMKVKEHKGSDGVVVTPTTQYTTNGKYVDPNDLKSGTQATPIPANAAVLDGAAGSSSAEQKATTATTTTKTTSGATASSSTAPILHMEPAAGTNIGSTKTEPIDPLADHSLDTDASAIAVDPAFREETRGRVSSGKAVNEDNDEARDTVAEQLSPPKVPGLPRASESPARETRFKEELFG